MGDRAMAGDRCRKMKARSIVAMNHSVEEGMVITTWVGNHNNVSAMCSDLVFPTHVQ